MHNSQHISTALRALAVATAALLAACSGSDSAIGSTAPATPAATTAQFELTLVNLTAGQPLSPMVALAHHAGFSMFNVGEPASVALEHIAEAGESAQMVALAGASTAVDAVAVAAGGPLVGAPDRQAKLSLTVPLTALPDLRLSVATMLGNTNDGFAGLNAQSLATLAVGAQLDARLLGYDAGTERNSESADTVPGPATEGGGGKREGYNATRDDIVNAVHLHPGVVGREDGLPTSALTQAQRWDNPVALLTIKRTR